MSNYKTPLVLLRVLILISQAQKTYCSDLLNSFERIERSEARDNDVCVIIIISGKTRVTYKLAHLTSVGSLCAHLRFSKKFGSDHIIFTQFKKWGK